jgi:hypothetical protein
VVIIDIKRAVSDGRKVKFVKFFDMSLWYETEFGETFAVPVDDIHGATFWAEDKAILLMRYMRQHNKMIENLN